MNLLIILVPLTLFLWMQAIYWFVFSRRAAHDAFISERLGTDASLGEGALMRAGPQGPLAERIANLLESAGEEPDVGPFLTRVMVSFFATFAIAIVVTGSPLNASALGLAACLLPVAALTRKRSLRLRRVEEQLPAALEMMSIALRAGQSLDQTIRHTASELQAPIADEFRQVADEQGLGRPLDEALLAMSNRLTGCRAVRTFVVSVLVLRQTGGNLVEVLEQIIDTMRQQGQYERKLRALTAEARTSSRILASIPPAFALMSYFSNPMYVSSMFTDPTGRSMVVVAVLLYFTGVFWVRRLTRPQS